MRSGCFTRRPCDEERALIERTQSRRATFFWALIPLGLFVAVFWFSFSPDVSFSYRDAPYYYYPFFRQIQGEWERGALPLWDPYANLGQPLLADPTASVFYPAKAIFFLSSFDRLSYSTCFKLYLWLHVGLAFVSCFLLSRRLLVSRVGALLSGLTYAFSGQVLFQYSNVVYLVGSAWAPAFFIFLVDYIRAKSKRLKFRATMKSSVVCALSVLGGEPQIVYVCLVASAIVLLLAPKRGRVDRSQEPESNEKHAPSKYARVGDAAFYCATTAFLAFLLAAIQILPSAELVGRSERSRDKAIRSVWDVPKAIFEKREKDDGSSTSVKDAFRVGSLCLDFSEGGRSCSIYRFSVGAWRWSEFLFPNVGGRQFPQSSRWFEAFPEELALWTPTLYCGVLPLLLALAAARLRPSRKESALESSDETQFYFRGVATWLVLFGVLAALGGFGLVWHVHAARALFDGDSLSSNFCDGDPVGGLYWLLNLLAPKFVEFRYPAKMLTTSVLGIAVLAGIGWDQERNSRRFRIVAFSLAACALLLWTATSLFGTSFFRSFSLCNPLYGPFQAKLAEKIVRNSFLQTLIVVVASLFFLRFARRIRNSRVERAFLFATLATTALDLYFANSWIIDVAPTKFFERRSEIERQLEEERALRECASPTRVYRYPVWFPPLFQEESSPRRTKERVLWDVATLYPKYPFHRGIAVIDARGATMESAYCAYVDRLISRTNVDEELAFLGVEQVVGPRWWVERILSKEDAEATSYDQSVASKRTRSTPTRAALFRGGERVQEDGAQDCVETLEYSPNRIVYFVRAHKPSEVVFAEQFWSDWRSKRYALTQEETKVLRAARGNRSNFEEALARRAKDATRKATVAPVEKAFEFLRKIDVPKGDYCVVVEYRPRAFFGGALISILAWGALFASGLPFLIVQGGRFRISLKRRATSRPD